MKQPYSKPFHPYGSVAAPCSKCKHIGHVHTIPVNIWVPQMKECQYIAWEKAKKYHYISLQTMLYKVQCASFMIFVSFQSFCTCF